MFYSTNISVTLWILNQNKKDGIYHVRTLRNRTGEVLFMDLRTWNEVGSRVPRDRYAPRDRYVPRDRYAEPELYYSAFRDVLVANNYSLVPSRYIEFVDRDTEIDYKTALAEAGSKAGELLARQSENAARLKAAFKALGVK